MAWKWNQKFGKAVVGIIAILLVANFIYGLFDKAKGEKYINDFFVASNNQDCGKLPPLTNYPNFNQNIICPRGDVGNFMVIDKVSYEVKEILHPDDSDYQKALVQVCIEARGEAAWNEGSYKDCTTDSRIIVFYKVFHSWLVDKSSLTDISQLISQSGEKPEGYDKWRSQCMDAHFKDVMAGGKGFDCNNTIRDDIEYSIKTHKFVEAGKAH